MNQELSSSQLQANRIQRLIADLRQAVTTHCSAAAKLTRRDQALQNRAATAIEQSREELEQKFDQHKEKIRAEHSATVAWLNDHYNRWQSRRHRAYDHLKKELASIGIQEEEQAKQQYQQQVWAIGSGVEATRDKIHAVRDSDLKRLAEVESALEKNHTRGKRLAKLVWLSLDLPEAAAEVGLEDDAEIDLAIEALTQDAQACAEQIEISFREAGPQSPTFKVLPAVLLVLALIHVSLAFLLPRFVDLTPLATKILLFSPLIWLASPYWVIMAARRRIRPQLEILREMMVATATVVGATRVQIRDRHAREVELVEQQHDDDLALVKEELERMLEECRNLNARHLSEVKWRYDRLDSIIEKRRKQAIGECERLFEQKRIAAEQHHPSALAELEEEHHQQLANLHREQKEAWEKLRAEWKAELHHLYTQLESTRTIHGELFPDWERFDADSWEPPTHFPPAIPFGSLQVNLEDEVEISTAEGMALPGDAAFSLPALMNFPSACNLLIESAAEGRDEALSTLQSVMLRLLMSLPPGKVSFTIIDPIGLGESFAGFMHLADYDERFVGRRIWVEPRHIEQQLADLNEHMEKVIQKYLRNEFETIAEFNESAGEMAERYRFLVVCDFPANFSEMAAQRLASVITSGARCGVFVLMHKDRREAAPTGFDMALLRRHSTWLSHEAGGYQWKGERVPEALLTLDKPPRGEALTASLQRLGESMADATRVEVPFAEIVPAPDAMWSRSSAGEIRVPIGKSGAHKLQEIVLGKGTSQHVLVAGKTGSGKSTLFHVLITSLSLWYSPDELEFYLIDFKKGVEFKCYAHGGLPHIRAVAIESDRDFGLSILHRVDQELKARGERFRQEGVQDISAYCRLENHLPTPRSLLLIDEFQELFVADDRIAQESALLLDRIVRQGRAFGIHVLLGSQTLGGAYSLPRATMGQMAVRIALQCSEADSYMILNDDNAAARLLSRPGEAIYNDSAGAVEGNSPFQVTWLSDHERDTWLNKVTERARESGQSWPEAIIFEGNAPSKLEDNQELKTLLATEATAPSGVLKLWLGQPNIIKSPTRVDLRRMTGNNVLIVGQNGEQARSLTASLLLSLEAQVFSEHDRVYLLDGSLADGPHAEYFPQLRERMGAAFQVKTYQQTGELVSELHEALTSRAEEESPEGAIVLIVFGLQRFKQLRQSDDYGFSFDEKADAPAVDKQFASLLTDGPEARIHTIAWCDSLNNVNRTLSRSLIGEFDYRILFQMSVNDSTTLIDTPEASKLGFHWGLLYDDQKGTIEKFRPYALPSLDHPLLNQRGLVPEPPA